MPCTCPLEKPLPTQCAPTLSRSHLSTTGAGVFQHSAFLCPCSRAGATSHQPGTVEAPGPLPGCSGTHPSPQILGEDSASSVHDLQLSKAPQCPCSGCSQVPSWHHWARLDAMWASTCQDRPRGATGSSWRGREQLTAALEEGHFPEKSPDGTWSAWGEERKLLPGWAGGQLQGRGPCILMSQSCPNPIPSQAPWGGRAAAGGAGWPPDRVGTEPRRSREQRMPGPVPQPSHASQPGHRPPPGGFLESPGAWAPRRCPRIGRAPRV